MTQRYEEEQKTDAGASIPNADAFVRLVNKIAAQAARREMIRRAQESERNQSRRRVRVRIAGRGDALYIISIAAKLAEMHPQTLRKYDREGLVSPSRTQGSRRLYSEEDLERLQIVRRLSEDLGLNLNGVGLVLELVQHMRGMLEVLEQSEDLTNSASAQAVADEIKVILNYLGVE
ncbi:MAG: MerR family transcriptional regulator [Chloroflexi bacterium]|nr:MerR family transcriptional regulator [Chloroflexota bacterium]